MSYVTNTAGTSHVPGYGVFALGRMRHLDLLTLWFRLHPRQVGQAGLEDYWLAGLSKEALVTAIITGGAS